MKETKDINESVRRVYANISFWRARTLAFGALVVKRKNTYHILDKNRIRKSLNDPWIIRTYTSTNPWIIEFSNYRNPWTIGSSTDYRIANRFLRVALATNLCVNLFSSCAISRNYAHSIIQCGASPSIINTWLHYFSKIQKFNLWLNRLRHSIRKRQSYRATKVGGEKYKKHKKQ